MGSKSAAGKTDHLLAWTSISSLSPSLPTFFVPLNHKTDDAWEVKHQPAFFWAKTTCVSLCTSSSKRQHQWLWIWYHSLCWLWVTENLWLTLPSNSNTFILQRYCMERMELNGWNTLWNNGLYLFCYSIIPYGNGGWGTNHSKKNHHFFLWRTCQNMFQ